MNTRGFRSKPTGKKRMKRRVFFILLIAMLFFVQFFIYIEKNLKPPLMNLAKIRIKQIATQSINTAISDRVAQETNFDKLIDWRTDNTGKVKGFMLNYAEHMRITADTTSTVQGLLDGLTEIPEHIPLGMAMNSTLFASFGPDIPIRLTPAGAVKVNVNTRSQNAGINMFLVEVYIKIIAEVTVIIPFDAESEIVETEIPLSYSLVVGDVPMYYFDNKGNPVGSAPGASPPTGALPNLNIGPSKEGEAPAPSISSPGKKESH